MSGRGPLGERLYQLRRQAKLTQQQLAGDVGVSQSLISAWELGSSRPHDRDDFANLARALDVPAEELVLLAYQAADDGEAEAVRNWKQAVKDLDEIFDRVNRLHAEMRETVDLLREVKP